MLRLCRCAVQDCWETVVNVVFSKNGMHRNSPPDNNIGSVKYYVLRIHAFLQNNGFGDTACASQQPESHKDKQYNFLTKGCRKLEDKVKW